MVYEYSKPLTERNSLKIFIPYPEFHMQVL